MEAIRYIRHHIGYDSYLNEYANYRKMPALSLFEVLEDIEDSAQNYQTLEEWEEALIEMSREIKNSSKRRSSDVLTLTTMHGAKGLEFDTVFIIDVIEGIIPYHKSQSQEEIEEERRLLYVGMTRAKKQLYLYIPDEKHGKPIPPSIFVQSLRKTMHLEGLKTGKTLYHKKLGKGTILQVMENGMIEVQFGRGEKRKIDSIYCMNNAIIKWEDE